MHPLSTENFAEGDTLRCQLRCRGEEAVMFWIGLSVGIMVGGIIAVVVMHRAAVGEISRILGW